MSYEIPEGRCVVCRQAWEPCRKCKGQAMRRKADATYAAKGKARNTPRPTEQQKRENGIWRDPKDYPHKMETRGNDGNPTEGHERS